MSDSHLLDSLKVLNDMMERLIDTAKLQPAQCADHAVEVPPNFVLPKPPSMLPTMQAHLDILSQSLGLPPVEDQ